MSNFITMKTDMISEAELAYTAGLLDGEGCICIWRSKKPLRASARGEIFRLSVTICNTHQGVVLWLASKFGGRIITKHAKLRSAKAYAWTINAGNALEFLRLMSPYLIIKKPEADIAIAFQTRMSGRKFLPRVRGNQMPSLTADEVSQMEAERIALQVAKKVYKEYGN